MFTKYRPYHNISFKMIADRHFTPAQVMLFLISITSIARLSLLAIYGISSTPCVLQFLFVPKLPLVINNLWILKYT